MVKDKVRKFNLQTVKSLARRLERSKKFTYYFGEKIGGPDEWSIYCVCVYGETEEGRVVRNRE